jgi:hypothetical protein
MPKGQWTSAPVTGQAEWDGTQWVATRSSAAPVNIGFNSGSGSSVGASYQTALPINYVRTGFLIQNTHASQTLTVAFGSAGQEVPQIVLSAGQRISNNEIGNFTGEIRVLGSGASTTYIATEYVQQLDVDPLASTIIASMTAGGYNLSTVRRTQLDTRIKNIKAAINGGVYTPSTSFPFAIYWDANFSVDTSIASNTKVWNLGTLGATGDGTMTNGNASNMVVTAANGRRYFQGTAANSRYILSTHTPTVTSPLTMYALVNRTASAQQTLMAVLNKVSVLPFLAAAGNKAGVAYEGGVNVDYTTDLTNGTWASLATVTTGSNYTMYRNAAQAQAGAVTLTQAGAGVFSAMVLGGLSNFLNSPANHFALATSSLTAAQLLALHTYLISDVL